MKSQQSNNKLISLSYLIYLLIIFSWLNELFYMKFKRNSVPKGCILFLKKYLYLDLKSKNC